METQIQRDVRDLMRYDEESAGGIMQREFVALTADATVDDAIERLILLAKIDAGVAELDAGLGIPHEEVKRRLGL